MSPLLDRLRALPDDAVHLSRATVRADDQRSASDAELLETIAEAARARRALDAVLMDASGHVVERSGVSDAAERMSTRHGCRDVTELLQRTTRLSRRSVNDLVAAAKAVRQPMGLSSGEVLPAQFPAVRDALGTGELSVESVFAVVGPLRAMTAGPDALAAADVELAAVACGNGVDGGPPASVEDLRQMAHVWAAYLDPDGAEPKEARALRRRGFTIGVPRDGVVPVRGNLLIDVAQQLQLGFDSLLNPKVDGAPVSGVRFVDKAEREGPLELAAETRTRAQKQHDALAIILTKATASLPTLGGAAPTLVVTVREQDLVSGRGYAYVNGSAEPLSLATARHIACTGAIQRVVMNENGRIVHLGTQDRVFTHHQRRAIVARDGTCITPGCHVPATWCEIHHIPDHAQGGPTHTDHGVPLCWFHHRTIDTSGWHYRITRGRPEVRGPHWWDPDTRWRPVTTSPTRLLDELQRRRQ